MHGLSRAAIVGALLALAMSSGGPAGAQETGADAPAADAPADAFDEFRILDPGEGLVGEAKRAFESGECPTFAMLERATGPYSAPFPLPDGVPERFGEGCVYGVYSGGDESLYLLARDAEPLQPVAAEHFSPLSGAIPPLYGHVPILNGPGYDAARAALERGDAWLIERDGGGGGMDALNFAESWTEPLVTRDTRREFGTVRVRLRGIEIAANDVDEETLEALSASMLPRFSGDQKVWRNTMLPDDTASVPEGRSTLVAVPAGRYGASAGMGEAVLVHVERDGDEVRFAMAWDASPPICASGRIEGGRLMVEGAGAQGEVHAIHGSGPFVPATGSMADGRPWQTPDESLDACAEQAAR